MPADLVPTSNEDKKTDLAKTEARGGGAMLPAASLAGLVGVLGLGVVMGTGAGVLGAVGAVLAAVTLGLYAINSPKLQRLRMGKQLDMMFAATEKAERVVAEARDLAASQVNLLLETYAGLGRLGGTPQDQLRAAAAEAESKLKALGCSSEEIEHGVHPAYKWIRRDHGLNPIQRAHAELAKAAGINQRDQRYVAWLKEFGKLYVTDPSPEDIARHLERFDDEFDVSLADDDRLQAAREVHRSLWDERPAPRKS